MQPLAELGRVETAIVGDDAPQVRSCALSARVEKALQAGEVLWRLEHVPIPSQAGDDCSRQPDSLMRSSAWNCKGSALALSVEFGIFGAGTLVPLHCACEFYRRAAVDDGPVWTGEETS